MPPFDFSSVDWSDEDVSPFDQLSDSDDDNDEFCLDRSSCCHSSLCYEAPVVEQRKRAISFAVEDRIHEIPSREDYSKEDVQATWYQREEFLAMRSQITHVLFLMENSNSYGGAGGIADSDTLTTRGLEYRTDRGGKKRTQNKKDAYYAVLGEQERQWRNGQEDPEHIAAVYKAVSSQSAAMAICMGIQDETDIRGYVQDTRQELLKFYSSFHHDDATTITTATSSTGQDDKENDGCRYEDDRDYNYTSLAKPGQFHHTSNSSCLRRMAVLEDIQILSRTAVKRQLHLNWASPAAA